MTKIAVITRTKDRPLFLQRALSSVASQTYTDYVHVVVNDGGKAEEIDAAIENLPAEARTRVRVFHRKTSSNAPDTIFNESIGRVQSEYFAIHDDDDTWHENYLELTVNHLEENKQLGAVVVRANKILEKVSGSKITPLKVLPWLPDMKVVNLYRQCVENQMSAGLTVYRRSAYEEVGRFDDTLPVVGDWEFGIRLLMKYDVDFIDPGFALANYHHRKHKPGTEGSSAFATNSHRYYTNLVMNRYLREELATGRLGVGYIMSKTRYSQAFISRLVSKTVPKFISNRLKNRLQG